MERAEALSLAARIYRDLGKVPALAARRPLAKAVDCYQRAIEADPARTKDYLQWAEALGEREIVEGMIGRLIAVAKADNFSADGAIAWDEICKVGASHAQQVADFCRTAVRNLDKGALSSCVDCGWELLKQRQKKAALRLARHAMALDAQSFDAVYLEGGARAALSDLAAAAKRFRQAIALKSNSFDAYHQRGRALAALEKHVQADRAFRQAFARGTDLALDAARVRRSQAHQDRAYALSEARRWPEALAVCAKAVDQDAADPWTHFRMAYIYSDMMRYEEAMREYEQACAYVPTGKYPAEYAAGIYPLHNVAYVLDARGQYRLARENWQKVREGYQKSVVEALIQRDADFCAYYGFACRTLRDFRRAEFYFRAAAVLDPDHAAFHVNLIDFQRERDKDPAARKEIADAGKRASTSWLVKLGVRKAAPPRKSLPWEIAEASGQALRLLQRRQKQNGNPLALTELGELHLLREDYEEAEKAFRDALAKETESVRIYKGLGKVNLRRGTPEAAVPFLQAARNLAPDDFTVMMDLAWAHADAKAAEKAEAVFREILDAAPAHVDAKVGLGEVYLAMADQRGGEPSATPRKDLYDQAIQQFSEALRIADSEDRPSVIVTSLASIYFHRGYARVQMVEAARSAGDSVLISQALADFRMCVKNDPEHSEAKRAIARIEENQAHAASQNRLERWGSCIVVVVSLLLCVAAQVMFFIGHPVYHPKIKLTEESLRMLEAVLAPGDRVQKLKPMADVEFSTNELLLARAKGLLGEKSLEPAIHDELLRQAVHEQVREWATLEVGYYALLTFGGLIFMIAGAYLPKLTGLKVAGFHLEKSTAERTEPTLSFGISRSGDGQHH